MLNFISNNLLDIVAIVISICTLIWTLKSNKDITEKTLNKEFFEQIYFDYIIIKLPDSLFKLEAKSGSATAECNHMKSLVLEILDKSIFYKYFDSDFYQKIKNILFDLDDILVRAASETNSTKFREYKETIQNLSKDLYKEFRQYYSQI